MRLQIIGVAVAMAALLAPGVAHAAPPANDDFDNATTVTALPFTATQTTDEATKSPDDPTTCDYWSRRTVWYRYTAQTDGFVKPLTHRAGQSGGGSTAGVFTGTRGALTEVACSEGTGVQATFHAKAGTTYHIALLDQYGSGPLTFDLRPVAPAPNDDFAAATPTTLPAQHTGDLSVSTTEQDEQAPTCHEPATRSVWYRYTADRTRSVAVTTLWNTMQLTVYRGTSLASLSEVDCPTGNDRSAAFTATAGTTYYIRVSAPSTRPPAFRLDITSAPAIRPFTSPQPNNPSVYSDVNFYVYAGDGLSRRLVSGEVRFGDGTSAPIPPDEWTPLEHRYAADGDYLVSVTGTTADGRSGTSTSTLTVETRDVYVSDFTAPATGRVGQTKQFQVSVSSPRHDESVEVELFRLAANGYYTSVGKSTQQVVKGAKVSFPFAYTYTAEDGTAGKVALKVVARMPNRYVDHNPADNELVAETVVRPRTNAF